MKKIISLVSAVTLILIITSCSKSYTCHCIYKTNGNVSYEDSSTISEGSKDKSSESCANKNSTSTSTVNGNTYTSTVECSIVD